MAVTKKPEEIIAEQKRTPVEKPMEKSQKNNKNAIMIAGAVVILLIAAMLFMTMTNVPPQDDESGDDAIDGEEDGITDTPDPGADLVGLDILLAPTIDAMSDAREFSAEGEMNMEMGIMGTSMSSAVMMTAEYDITEKKAKITAKTSSESPYGNVEETSESYIIEDTMYMKIPEGYGNISWIKQGGMGSIWNTINAEEMVEMVELFEGKVVATETVSGKLADKIMISTDIKDMVDAFTKQQDLAELGLGPGDVSEMMEMLEDSIKKMEIYLWVAKDSALPIKTSGILSMDIDPEDMGAGMGSGAITIDLDFEFDLDFASDVRVTLPAGAMDASPIDVLYGTGDLVNLETL